MLHALFPAHPVAQAIVVITAVLLTGGLGLVWRAYHVWVQEKACVRALQEPECLPGLWAEANAKDPGRRRIARRVAEVVHAGSQARQVQEALSARDVAEVEDRIHWPRFIAGICVFVGLVGTIFGLSEAISSITPGGTNLDQLQQQLRMALAGMNTGFTCTLWGVIASIILGTAVSWHQKQVATLEIELDRYVLTRLIPSLPVGLATGPDGFADTLNCVADRLRATLEPFSRSLAEGGRQIDHAAAALGGSVPALDGFQAGLQRIMDALGSHLPEIAQAEYDSRAQVLLLSERLAALAERLESNVPELARGSAAVTGAVTDLRREFEGLLAQLQRAEEQRETARAEQLRELGLSVRTLEQAVGLMRETVAENPALKKVAEVSADIGVMVGQLQANGELVSNGGARVVEGIRQIAQRFDHFNDGLAEHLAREGKMRAEQMQSLAATYRSLKGLIDLVEDSLKDVAPLQARVQEITADTDDTLGTLRGAAGSLQEASGSLSRISPQLQAQIEALERLVRSAAERPRSGAGRGAGGGPPMAAPPGGGQQVGGPSGGAARNGVAYATDDASGARPSLAKRLRFLITGKV